MSRKPRPEKKQAKPWYKSKTVWFNVATVVAAVLTGIESMLNVLAPVVSPVVMPWILFGVGLANLVLRTITTEGLTGVTRSES